MYRSIASRAKDSVIVCRTAQNTTNTGADYAIGIGASPANIWINGLSSIGYAGATDISSLYDICRVIKMEVSLMWDFNTSDVSSTGTAGMPIVYTAFDPTDNAQPTLSTIQQYASTRVSCVGDAKTGNRIVRTIYPRCQQLQSGMTIIQEKNPWVETISDIPYNGLKIYIDYIGTPNTNRIFMYTIKVWLECKVTK